MTVPNPCGKKLNRVSALFSRACGGGGGIPTQGRLNGSDWCPEGGVKLFQGSPPLWKGVQRGWDKFVQGFPPIGQGGEGLIHLGYYLRSGKCRFSTYELSSPGSMPSVGGFSPSCGLSASLQSCARPGEGSSNSLCSGIQPRGDISMCAPT